MYLSILVLPLLGSLSSGLLGRRVGVTGVYGLSCGCLLLSSVLATVAFVDVGLHGSSVSVQLVPWVDTERMAIAWECLFDPLAVTMCLPVLYISTLIHVFSVGYMAEDPHVQRFFAYLSLFTFFMLVLVLGANYFVMFVGWEGIGIVSYLLINFWFTRVQANKAAILALTMNRVGDMGLSIGFFALFGLLGSLDYGVLFDLGASVNGDAITIVGLLLLAGAMAKSAQLPLHSWLPGSMEGPTPVSALIHAATLVTAGLYLLVRSSPILEYSSTVLLVITLVGATTALFAATCGLVQNDLKRIVAFSTISQLGYMVMAVGMSEYGVALMHVVNHAFFKALLFLGAGAIIHSVKDQQDVRRMGGLVSLLPFTYSTLLVGTVALLGLPWLTGFYSKDLIVELAYAKYSFGGHYAYWLGTLTAGLTAFYSFRLISWVFLTVPNASRSTYVAIHEASLTVAVPLAVLSVLSILFGYAFSDLFVGVGSPFLDSSLFVYPVRCVGTEVEFSVSSLHRGLPTVLSLLGVACALVLYHRRGSVTWRGNVGYAFLNGKYGFDVLYNRYVVDRGLHVSYVVSSTLDRGVLEVIGPYGVSRVLYATGSLLRQLDTGIVTTYGLYVVLGILLITSTALGPLLLFPFPFSEDLRLGVVCLFALWVSLR